MAVGLITSDQFVRRQGLRARPPYSRIILLQLTTLSGSGNRDNVSSPALASKGILLGVHIHVHHSVVNQAGSATVWLGFNQQQDLETDGGTTFRDSIIQTVGGLSDSIVLDGVDLDYDLRMKQLFSGDKTRLSAACRTFNTFTTRIQLFFEISEG